MSQEKKYQVFISSTYTDLVEAREKATKVILDLYHLPVGMEMFSADDDDQWKIITDAIDVSDYYVLIIGHRYGSLTNKGISYTEKEFNYAKSKKIPIISFIRDRNVAVSNSDREPIPESLIKLDKFIEKAKNGKMCAFWSDVSDLERQIAVALPKSFARHKGIGWVRGDSKSEHVAEEIARLSEDNRKLREENSRLNELSNSKNPLLRLLINGNQRMDVIQIKTYKLKENECYCRPEMKELNYSINSFFGAESYDESVQKYNDIISEISEDQIEEHNGSLEVIQKLQHACVKFELSISNYGNTIANAISMEIEIPENIVVINNFEPYDLNYFRKEHRNKLINDIEFNKLYGIVKPSFSNKCQIYDDILTDLPYPVEMEKDLIVRFLNDGKKILVEKDKLLHSRDCYLENLYLFPKFTGKGIIKINLICAELTEPLVYEIPLEVVE